MRTLLACTLLAALIVPAAANAQKTGYEIGGCAFYYLNGDAVVQLCDLRDPKRNPRFWDEFAIVSE